MDGSHHRPKGRRQPVNGSCGGNNSEPKGRMYRQEKGYSRTAPLWDQGVPASVLSGTILAKKAPLPGRVAPSLFRMVSTCNCMNGCQRTVGRIGLLARHGEKKIETNNFTTPFWKKNVHSTYLAHGCALNAASFYAA